MNVLHERFHHYLNGIGNKGQGKRKECIFIDFSARYDSL
jgi:hypothetical protein